tara:strand:+ start:4622 stop:5356 length:735 start_codon:yes stop_codon:yes gene_type:complete
LISEPTLFLFVHGGFHGGWCWERVLPRLRARGHHAATAELGYPDEQISSIGLLDHWAKEVIIRAEAVGERVVAVAHSRGGLIVSQAAELSPDIFRGLVFCGAMLVNDGETTAAARSRLGCAPPPLKVLRDPASAMIIADSASAADTIYSSCNAGDAAIAVSKLAPERDASLAIAPRLSSTRYGSVPRAMIECLNDKILPIGFQRAMRSTQPCDIVLTLACDHAPFFSDPEGLAAALDAIALRWS